MWWAADGVAAGTREATVYERNIEKTFTVAPGGELLVQADLGSIEIVPGDGDRAEVRVAREVRRAAEGDADRMFADHEVTFTQEGRKLLIVARRRSPPTVWRRNAPTFEVRFRIALPRRFDVDLTTAGGDIRLGDLEGKARLGTSSGAIATGMVAGPVDARNAGGDITVAECRRAVTAKTSSGAIRLPRVEGKVDATNAGGDIVIGSAAGPVLAQTSSGAIVLDSCPGDVDVRTAGGDIKIGTVGGSLNARTSSGSVVLKQSRGGQVNVHNAGGDIRVGEVKGDLSAETTSGLIAVDSARGKVRTRNSGGDVKLGVVEGDLEVRTSSGAITVGSVAGKAELRNAGGDIRVDKARNGLVATTSSGNIRVELTAQPAQETQIETTGGGVVLVVPGGLAVSLDARTQGGRVTTDLPVEVAGGTPAQDGTLAGKINGGGIGLRLRATSGDIAVRRAGGK